MFISQNNITMKMPFSKTIKLAAYTFICAGLLSLTACKGKSDSGDDHGSDHTTEVKDTTPAEGMTAVPAGDTIVRKNDTIVKTGTKNDTKENPVGEQVP